MFDCPGKQGDLVTLGAQKSESQESKSRVIALYTVKKQHDQISALVNTIDTLALNERRARERAEIDMLRENESMF